MLGIDQVLENVVKQLGNLELAVLVGDYALGKDTGIIDLVLVGRLDQSYLLSLVQKTEALIRRRLRTLCLTPEEYQGFKESIQAKPYLIIWQDAELVSSLQNHVEPETK
jgi:hypothetical protein